MIMMSISDRIFLNIVYEGNIVHVLCASFAYGGLSLVFPVIGSVSSHLEF